MDTQTPAPAPGPSGPGVEDEGDDTIIKLAGAAGAVILAVGLLVIFMIAPEPAPETASAEKSTGYKNGWPSKKDLGISDKPYRRPEKKSDEPPVKRTGTPFGDNSGSFLITTPSFGKLRTPLDWDKKESELLSIGTPKSTWQLAHFWASGRNPKKNYGTAISYLQDALYQGAGVAAYDLARAYDRGTWGVREDKSEARRYYQIALEHGISNAKDALKRLQKDGY